MNLDPVLTEARAHLFWGKDEQEVKAFLLDRGLKESAAEQFIIEVKLEKSKELEGKAKQSILACIPAFGLAALCFIIAVSPIKSIFRFSRHSHDGDIFTIGALLCFGFGVYKLINGYLDLLKSDREGKQLSKSLKAY